MDTDHDLYLSLVDLSRFQNGSLSSKIIERILLQPSLPPYSTLKTPKGRITYKDFVCAFLPIVCLIFNSFLGLLLCEENKATEASVEYWFRCVGFEACLLFPLIALSQLDIDGDGYISGFELDFFYQEQSERLKKFGLDVARFEDIYCQMYVQPPVSVILMHT